jgi:hypothetical protein
MPLTTNRIAEEQDQQMNRRSHILDFRIRDRLLQVFDLAKYVLFYYLTNMQNVFFKRMYYIHYLEIKF